MKIILSKQAQKDLQRVPSYIAAKARLWVDEVKQSGLEAAQRNPRWQDEAKAGRLQDIRTIRLNREYRLFYLTLREDTVFITVLEINHHDYKKIERRYR